VAIWPKSPETPDFKGFSAFSKVGKKWPFGHFFLAKSDHYCITKIKISKNGQKKWPFG